MEAKPATLLKVTLLHGCFSRFLNSKNGTKSLNALLIYKMDKHLLYHLMFYNHIISQFFPCCFDTSNH